MPFTGGEKSRRIQEARKLTMSVRPLRSMRWVPCTQPPCLSWEGGRWGLCREHVLCLLRCFGVTVGLQGWRGAKESPDPGIWLANRTLGVSFLGIEGFCWGLAGIWKVYQYGGRGRSGWGQGFQAPGGPVGQGRRRTTWLAAAPRFAMGLLRGFQFLWL